MPRPTRTAAAAFSRRARMIAFLLLTFVAAQVRAADVHVEAQRILTETGVRGGFIVHLQSGDGSLTSALRVNGSYRVQGLDTDAATIDKARAVLIDKGVYGPVTIDRWNGRTLPYVSNFVNLIVAAQPIEIADEEIMRVLAPLGVAYLKRGDKWTKTVKPWPDTIDQWTHFLHGADNNAVANDTAVGVPRAMQWVCEPKWGRGHEQLASFSAAVSSNGRLFYIVDEAPLASIRFDSDWKLIARDGFNGTLLWKVTIPKWVDQLRHFRSGPAHLPRRLVAVGDTVYVTAGLAGPVLAIDAATGKTTHTFADTERTEEILHDGGVLYLVVGSSEVDRRGGGLSARGEPEPTDYRYITAIDATTRKALWKVDCTREGVLPLTLAVKGDRVYFQSTAGIVCLDGKSGTEQWRTPRPTPALRMGFSAPTLVATDDVVLNADRDTGKGPQNQPSTGAIVWGINGWNENGFARNGACTLRAFSARDGKELWSAPCGEGYNSPVDLFVIDGVVWVGPQYAGLDLHTGKTVGKIDTSAPRVGMSHPRCYRNKASERFIFTGKSGIEVLSIEKGWLSNNSWVRGTCQYGIMPTNGLIYAPPDACACFLTVKAPGLVALAPQRDLTPAMPAPEPNPLEKGPRYGETAKAATSNAGDWPMYRHDPARSGATAAALPGALKPAWSQSLGGRLTQPVVAGGKVFVAATNAHSVYALSESDGRVIWRYTAGGPIDSSPTVHEGNVLFGSADGYVYCVNSDDGRLAWRFRAAPRDRRISVYDQIESAWPVHGSVVVQNGAVYATAGRSTYIDGGILLYRINPRTGEQLSQTLVYELDTQSGAQLVPEAKFNMEGTTSDLLSGDGDSVFLKYFTFDRDGKRTEATKPHLFSITGFLGEDWFVRSYWFIGEGMPGAGWGGWANSANANTAGRLLCFNDRQVCGYGRVKVVAGATGHEADAYHLFAVDPSAVTTQLDRRGKKIEKKGKSLWSDEKSLIVRAMVLGKETLAVAGPVDEGEKQPGSLTFRNPAEALASFEGKKEVYLRLVSAADGKTLSQLRLESLPTFDAMSSAHGKLFLATMDGKITCFGE